MTERLDSANKMLEIPVEKARRFRGPVVWLCVAAWTVVVSLVLWWLLQANPPSVLIVGGGGALQPLGAEKFHAFFKSDSGFLRVYPWVLFGPYAALLAMYFPLERGRLRLNLPINVAACAAFLAAAHAIDARTSARFGNVTIIRTQVGEDSASGSRGTNSMRIQVSGFHAGDMLQEQTVLTSANAPTNGALDHIAAGKWREFPDTTITNLLARGDLPFGPALPPRAFPTLVGWPTLLDLVAYAAILGLAHSVHFYRRFREREHRAIFLESTLANARLNALRAQLQPHFLFNSLNAVATLLRRDPRLAETTLMSLSELLRLALSQSEKQEIPLREEMEFVQRYMDIQQTRFADRFRVEQDIEPAALDCLVPSLLLQPLVENAIRHGIEPAENAGIVRLTAYRRDGRLVLSVEDNGVGLPRAAIDLPAAATERHTANGNSLALTGATEQAPSGNSNGGTGIGLANLRARLAMLYGGQQKLELSPRPAGGVRVEIELPWRTAVPAETSNRS